MFDTHINHNIFSLPNLREDARKALMETLKGLEQLPPPPPENPAVELLRLLTTFSTETKQWIDGSEKKERLIQICKVASAEFKKNILQTAPNFRPFKNLEEEEELEHPFDNSVEDDVSDGASNVDAHSTMFLLDVREYVAK